MASGSINVTAIHYEPTDTTTFPDGTPITIQPLSVTWVSLTGRLAFYW
jgi:hypothetical protein